MKDKFALILMSVFLCIIGMTASAATYGDLTYTISNGKVTITKCKTSATGELVIPNTIEDHPVTAIKAYAFTGCSNIASITIPNSITSIAESTFTNCTSLTDVTISNNITSIGDFAFRGCKNLTSITIPDSVTYIGESSFSYCYGLTSITIPKSVTTIGEAAFYNCIRLESIYVDNDNVKYSDSNGVLLSGDRKTLILYPPASSGNYTIPDSVTTISDYAFSECYGLTDVIIPDGVTSIGKYAFLNSYNITSISMADSVTSIGMGAFYKCYELTSVTISNNITSISDYAFYFCKKLRSLTIPDSVTSIGKYAFSKCSLLTNIVIPSNVTSIGKYAFSDCYALTSITIPDNVTSIEYATFYNCTKLTTIILPDSVTFIDLLAFSNTGYINDDNNWIDDVLYIGNHLIRAKESKVGDYTILNNVKYIACNAFKNCKSLISITIPESVISISVDAFYRCDNLTKIYKPISALWEHDFGSKVQVIPVCKVTYKLNDEIIGTEYAELNKKAKHLTPPEGYKYVYTVNGEKWNGNVTNNTYVTVVRIQNPIVNLVPEAVIKIDNKYNYKINMQSDIPLTSKFIIGLYDSSERLIAYDTHDITGKTEYFAESVIQSDVKADTYKAFLWKDLSTLEPLSPILEGAVD